MANWERLIGVCGWVGGWVDLPLDAFEVSVGGSLGLGQDECGVENVEAL